MPKLMVWVVLAVLAGSVAGVWAQPVSECLPCHAHYGAMMWPTNPHAHSQANVTRGLDSLWTGYTPDSVIATKNCIGCHAPRAVAMNGGMTEAQALGYWFSTTGGVFTDTTRSLNTENWPEVACRSCHDVPAIPHPNPINIPLRFYNSTTASYDSVRNTSELCGKCHGNLRFPDSDRRIFWAWQQSKHGHGGQSDLASALATDWVGRTPADVISSADSNDCVWCHAPTATKLGDITETQVLSRFFTTVNGRFTANTTVIDTLHWPEVACNSCHDPHQPDSIACFDPVRRAYYYPLTRDQQCGQCHGNLRFAYSKNLSYNIEQGTGGVGVPNDVMMPGAHCTDCHMHRLNPSDPNSMHYGGHLWSVFVDNPDGSTTVSCAVCHAGMSADSARTQVRSWQADYAALDSQAVVQVALADSALQGSSDTLALRYLDEAKQNLSFAHGDESHGAHNHTYVMALLQDAVDKADSILGLDAAPKHESLPQSFALLQNYPNPFNPTTEIRFTLATQVDVKLQVFNELGERVSTLIEGSRPAGSYAVTWDGRNAAAGIYFYRLQAGNFVSTRKMLLLK